MTTDLAILPADQSASPLPPSALARAQETRTMFSRLAGALPVVDRPTLAVLCRIVGLPYHRMRHTLLDLTPPGSLADRLRFALSLPLEKLAPEWSGGRPTPWAELAEQPGLVNALLGHYTATISASTEQSAQGRHTGSMSLALLRLADESWMHPDRAAELRRGRKPAALLRLMRRITPEIEAKLRGPKHYQHAGPAGRRAMTVIRTNGAEVPLMAGDLWELDDMSANHPFFVRLDDGSYLLSRQTLYCRDVASGKWLSLDRIVRPRQSYRAEDILRTLRKIMLAFGKPRIGLRLERGAWASQSIQGWSVPSVSTVPAILPGPSDLITLAGMEPSEKSLLQSGLKALGIHLIYAFSSRGKAGIEGGFNYLQRVEATMSGAYQHLGRHAGEFERAARELRAAQDNVSADPSRAGFAPIEHSADLGTQAMTWINARPMDRLGCTRDEAWTRDIALHPLPVLEPQDLAATLPDVRENLMIRGGRVTVTLDGCAMDFRAPQAFAAMGDTYRVSLRFDPADLSLGAAIYNAETSSKNWMGAKVGQLLCWAQYETPGPQIDLRDPAQRTPRAASEAIQAQKHWHATAFRALPRPGQPALKSSVIRVNLPQRQPVPVMAAAPAAPALPEFVSAFDRALNEQ